MGFRCCGGELTVRHSDGEGESPDELLIKEGSGEGSIVEEYLMKNQLHAGQDQLSHIVACSLPIRDVLQPQPEHHPCTIGAQTKG